MLGLQSRYKPETTAEAEEVEMQDSINHRPESEIGGGRASSMRHSPSGILSSPSHQHIITPFDGSFGRPIDRHAPMIEDYFGAEHAPKEIPP